MTYFETGTLAGLMILALTYGFTGTVPQFGHKAVKGAALIVLGVAAVFMKIEFVAAAFLVANGTRMTWTEARKEKEVGHEKGGHPEAGHAIGGDDHQPRLEQAAPGAFQLDGADRGNSPALDAPAPTRGVPARVEELRCPGTRLI